MISFFGQGDSLGHLIQSSEHHRIGRIECCRTGLGAMKCSCGKWQVTFYKSTSSSFHAFGSHQFIKDSALLLLNPLKDQSIFHFISSPFRNLTLTRHITSVYYQTIPKRMWFWLTGWRKNRHTIDSLRSSVLQESYHDSRLELSDGRWDYTSAIILECLLFLLALCNVNAAGAN